MSSLDNNAAEQQQQNTDQSPITAFTPITVYTNATASSRANNPTTTATTPTTTSSNNTRVATIAAIVNFMTYTLWTLMNKRQFLPVDEGGLGVTSSLAATSTQMMVAGLSAALILFGLRINYRPHVEFMTLDVLKHRILPLGVARAVDIGCANMALVFVTVALQQVIKSSLPVFVSILSVLLLNKTMSRETWITLLPIVVGTVAATLGEISGGLFGILLALTSCFGRAFKAVLNARLLHAQQAPLLPLEILLLESPTTGLILLVPALLTEFDGGATLLTTPHLLFYNVLCGVLMFVNQLSYITIIQQTSALTCQVLMNMKMLFVILVSVMLFHTQLHAVNYLGMSVATAGCMWFAFASSKPQKVVYQKAVKEMV